MKKKTRFTPAIQSRLLAFTSIGSAMVFMLSACDSSNGSSSSGSVPSSADKVVLTASSPSPSPKASASPKTSPSPSPSPKASASPSPSPKPSPSPSASSEAFNLPPQVCTPQLALDTSAPEHIVGHGAGTCTEALFAAAVQAGGKITFDCGGAATIPITTTHVLHNDINTTIDGGGLITLDGGGKTRILSFTGPNWRTTRTVVTIQNLHFNHAKSSGTVKFPPASPPCSQGYEDGGGAAILFQDGILHVINSAFDNGAGASPGPDIAGGAIYSLGSLETIIQGSRFTGNTASNGGAVGSLNSDLTLINDLFQNNQATGTGGNNVNSTCPIVNGQRETGSGGDGGAVSIDGAQDSTVDVCGTTFSGNVGGTLGGALFRTPDGSQQEIIFDRTTFNANKAPSAGAAYIHNSALDITASTFSNNVATEGGAIQADSTQISFVNSTFAGNSATLGLGGGLLLFGNGGTIQNCTFANNTADGGSGYFGAALAGFTPLTIKNSIFLNDDTKDGGSPMACAMGSSTGNGDFQWPSTHVVGSNPDPACASTSGTKFANTLLGSLASNGGPTQTMVPGSGSPAIDAVSGCPTTDQRGKARNTSKCTAGAVEP